MAGMHAPASPASIPQLELFEFSSTRLADGRFVITPIRFAKRDEIDMHEARRLLSGMQRERVTALIEAGEIEAWRPEGRRTKYRIARDSVLAYKSRMRVMK